MLSVRSLLTGIGFPATRMVESGLCAGLWIAGIRGVSASAEGTWKEAQRKEPRQDQARWTSTSASAVFPESDGFPMSANAICRRS